jgi:phosphopantothenate---cysteine ligase (CTP)
MLKKINRLVITSGPTREWIDPVRFISNPSSGQTGYQIAQAAKNKYTGLFEEIILISGPGDSKFRSLPGIVNISVDTTSDMLEAVHASVDNHTLLIMAAAPADFSPAEFKNQKIKKPTDDTDSAKENSEEYGYSINLKAAPDILLTLKNAEYTDFIKVGFAAETENLEEYAKGKLLRKNLDYIAGNFVNRDHTGFSSSENCYYIYGADNSEKILGPAPKSELSESLLEYIIRREIRVSD